AHREAVAGDGIDGSAALPAVHDSVTSSFICIYNNQKSQWSCSSWCASPSLALAIALRPGRLTLIPIRGDEKSYFAARGGYNNRHDNSFSKETAMSVR